MIDLQRGEHVRHVDAEELRLGAVDVEIELRRRGLEQGEDLREDAGRLAGLGPHGGAARPQGLGARGRRGPRPSCESRRRCRCRAPAAARRRKISASLDRRELCRTGCPQCRRRLTGILRAVLRRPEHQKRGPGVRRVGEGRAGEADDVDGADTPGVFSAIDDAPLHRVGARQRRAGRQLRHHDEIAAIERRDEAAGCR